MITRDVLFLNNKKVSVCIAFENGNVILSNGYFLDAHGEDSMKLSDSKLNDLKEENMDLISVIYENLIFDKVDSEVC